MRWVVDASVAAKWLAPEPESPLAEALLDDELIVPDLLFAEVANILWKKQLRGERDPATAAVASRWLAKLPLQVHGGAALVASALALAVWLAHPAYGCFYLALALHARAPRVTADRRPFERCQRSDVPDLQPWVLLLGGQAAGATA